MSKRLLPILLVCAGAALAAPAAHADVYCVKKPSCSGPGRHDAPDLATALYKAQQSLGTGDTIHIGEGEFATGTGLVYDAGGKDANSVRIVGSGPKTVLRADTPSKSATFQVLTVKGTGSASTSVEDVAVRVPVGLGSWSTGLALEHASAARITVAGESGGWTVGAELGPDGRLSSSTRPGRPTPRSRVRPASRPDGP